MQTLDQVLRKRSFVWIAYEQTMKYVNSTKNESNRKTMQEQVYRLSEELIELDSAIKLYRSSQKKRKNVKAKKK